MGRYAITYDALLSGNLMNQELERWTDFNEDPVPDWRRRTYVAVTATGPEVELGVEGAREEASFHVVVGKW
jgi:hypothetical protein